MKKLAVFLLCLSMLSASAVVAYAEDSEVNTAPGEATIGTVVPDSHKITVTVTGNAEITLDGKSGTEFTVERLSEPELKINVPEGEEIKEVTINGVDVTEQVTKGVIKLPPVHEDETLDINVVTAAATKPTEPTEPEQPTEPTEPTPSVPVQPSGGINYGVNPKSVIPVSRPNIERPQPAASPTEDRSNTVQPQTSAAPTAATVAGTTAPAAVNDNTNPDTGSIMGGVTAGAALLISAICLAGRKHDKDEE